MDDKVIPVITTEYVETMSRAEIDMQIATAKTYPREVVAVIKKELMELATANKDTAEACSYALPRKQKNEKTGQWENVILQGPSVRLAEMVVYVYGNIRAGARTVGNDGRKVKAQGFCHDLQKNIFNAFEVERKIVNKDGKTFTEDMQIMTANAAGKIAWRNSIFTTIPGVIWQDTYDKCLEIIRGTEKDLPQRRDSAVKWFEGRGVTREQIFDALLIRSIDEIDLEKLQILSGMKASIANKEFSIEDLFPKDGKQNNEEKKKTGDDLLGKTQEMIDEALSKRRTK
jgi:hypothetical protein